MKTVRMHLMATSTLALAIYATAAAPAFAQAPDRHNAQEQATESSQDIISSIEAADEAKQKEAQIDTNEAAETLEESSNEDESSDISTGILGKLPSQENLTKIARKIQNQPNNLDHYFTYAQMADALGDYEKTVETYEKMLTLAPKLDRIRLDLGAAYLRLGRFEDAKRELEIVLSKKIPDSVRPNVEKVLAQVDAELQEHDITGSFTIGTNWDTNGNSAPTGKSVLVLDTPIALSGDALPQKELQFFTAISANHTYRPRWAQSKKYAKRWKTSASHYRTKQASLEDLNIQVFSLKTGPEFKSNASGTTVHPSLTRSQIVLAGQTYLRTTTADIGVNAPISQQMLVNGSYSQEWRNFDNSTTVSTYKDRNGTASQLKLGATYIATEKDIFNLGLTHRRERTRQNYYDNQQATATLGYTRILPYDSFASTSLSYKNTLYDGADTLISSQRRHDTERSAGITLGHKLADELTATLGYQYRDVGSNIPNYEYDNHRISASLTYAF